MRKLLLHSLFLFSLSVCTLASGMAVYAAQGASSVLSDTTEVNRSSSRSEVGNNRSRSFFSTWFLQPFRSAAPAQSEKLLSNVKVFPNPSGESLSVSFQLGKRADVSVKIMDALGNELHTLFSQTLDSGLQNHSFDIQQKLSSGFYFVRVSAGTTTVVKRISIL